MIDKLRSCPVCGLWHNGEDFAEGNKVLEVRDTKHYLVRDICPTHKPVYKIGKWFLVEVTSDFPPRRVGRIAFLAPSDIRKLYGNNVLGEHINKCRVLICDPKELNTLITFTNHETKLTKEGSTHE